MKSKNLFLILLWIFSALAGTLRAQAAGFGNALSFNGVNQYVSVPNFGSIVPTNEITVEFWANASAYAQQSAFMLQPDNPANRFNSHISYNNGNTYWDFGNINTSGRVFAANPPNTIGNWVHYALVASQSGNYMLIYTNGNLFATNSGMTPFVPAVMNCASAATAPIFLTDNWMSSASGTSPARRRRFRPTWIRRWSETKPT